jgi:hypothetical protein
MAKERLPKSPYIKTHVPSLKYTELLFSQGNDVYEEKELGSREVL